MKLSLLLLIVILALTVFALCVTVVRLTQKMRRKDCVLAREIAEHVAVSDRYLRLKGRTDLPSTQKDRESIPLLSSMYDAELFEFLRVVIVSEGLFLSPTFGRHALVMRFRISDERIISAFAHGSKFGSLQQFINECRLNESVKILAGHPEISVSDVARLSGFVGVEAFEAAFQYRYSFTPDEFRQRCAANKTCNAGAL